MLQSVGKVYGEEAIRRRTAGRRHQGYELVQEVADFKAEVYALKSKRARETAERKRAGSETAFLLSAQFWDIEDLDYRFDRWQFADGQSTLAIETKRSLVRYIVSVDRLQYEMGI